MIANIILSYALLLGSVSTTGLPRPQFADGPYVVRLVEKDCPAARADIRPRDVILSVNGQKVNGDEVRVGPEYCLHGLPVFAGGWPRRSLKVCHVRISLGPA